MTVGEMRGLATFLRSIREEWQTPPILAALEKLSAEKYSTQDITEACTAIALDHNMQLPVMLSMKGAEVIRRKHESKGKARSSSAKLPDQYKCDWCGKVQSACQTAAGNLNGADHGFVSAAERNEDRDQMHTDGRIAAARANALSKAAGGLFALPADVTNPTHPEPQQEEEAS
jgi:hypothetical protein